LIVPGGGVGRGGLWRRLDRPLREKRWQDFARGYKDEGPAGASSDRKLADAYKKYAKERTK
jgi:hypothetical protein